MSGDRQAYLAAMREADALARALKWESAVLSYRLALDELPKDATARISLATALTRLGDLNGALKEYLQSRELLPDDTVLLGRIGDLYIRLDRPGDAARMIAEQSQMYHSRGDSTRALSALTSASEHAGHDVRVLAIVSEAARGIGTAAALAIADQADRLIAEEPASVDDMPVQVSSTSAADTAGSADSSADFALGDERTESSSGPRVSNDPSQLIEAARQNADSGNAALAAFYFLTAAELLRDQPSGQDALRSAETAASEWLPGEASEVLELPENRRWAVLEAMHDSHENLVSGYVVAVEDDVYRAVGCAPSYLPAQIRLADVERRDERLPRAISRLGTVAALYELRGQRPRAVAVLRLQVEMDSDREAGRRRLIDFMLGTIQNVKAAEELSKWAGEARADNQLQLAAERYRESISLVASPEALVPYGQVEEELGDVLVARDSFERSLETAPGNVEALAGSTRCAAALDEWTLMESRLDVLGGLLRTDAALRPSVLGRFRDSITRVGRLPGLLFCLGTLTRVAGDPFESESLLREASSSESRAGRLACYHLGEIADAASRPADALRWFWLTGTPATTDDPSDRELSIAGHRRIVEVGTLSGDLSSVARAIEGLILLFPAEDALHTRLAETYFRLGDTDAAVRVLGDLGAVYASRGELDRSLGVERARIQIAPSDGAIRARMGRLLLSLDRTDEAMAEFDVAVKPLEELGHLEGAIELVRLMLDYFRHRDPARAILLRENLVRLAPDDLPARFDLVDAFIKLGRSVRAETEARLLVDRLVAAGNAAEAARALRIIISLAPWNVEDRVRLGQALGEIGQTEEALAILREVIARDPNNAAASASLTHLLALVAAESPQTGAGPDQTGSTAQEK